MTTKTKKAKKTEFVFYRGNKTAGRFTMTLEEIKEGYRAWCARTLLVFLGVLRESNYCDLYNSNRRA